MIIGLKYTNIVVLGLWNPAIVSPGWLTEQQIAGARGTEVELQFNPYQRIFKFDLGGITWYVDYEKLEVRSDAGADCGKYASRVLELLSHTPVHAIGTNFAFECDSEAWPQKYRPCLGPMRCGAPSDPNAFLESKWQASRQLDDKSTRLQLIVTEGAGKLELLINFHRSITSANEAKNFAERWTSDRELAFKFAKDYFGVDVS